MPLSGSAWSCFSHVSADNVLNPYEDVLGQSYQYDSRVGNHQRIQEGDTLVIRDGNLVRGFGVANRIESFHDLKRVSSCPFCDHGDIAIRLRKMPEYRCNRCKREFDEPRISDIPVKKFIAHYDSTWVPLEPPIPHIRFGSAYTTRDRQSAIRRLDPQETTELIFLYGRWEGALLLEQGRVFQDIPSGLREQVTRQRLGQARFREWLLQENGSLCAVTGPQPAETLDAAHISQFAADPKHRSNGGLLLRADVHRLFDNLLLSVNPANMQTSVAPVLTERFPKLLEIDVVQLQLGPRYSPDKGHLDAHFSASRSHWKQLAR